MAVHSSVDAGSTREKIKAAAGEVFVKKGYAAARMQEIANLAGANKAMIYYYFSSKEALFEAILREAFQELVIHLADLLELRETDPRRLIKRLVHVHFRFLLDHPQLPGLVARELNSSNPLPEKVLADVIKQLAGHKIFHLHALLQKGIAQGAIRRVDTKQLLWSIVSLNIFSFIAWPILRNIWPKETKQFDKVMQKREKAVVDLILNGLLPK